MTTLSELHCLKLKTDMGEALRPVYDPAVLISGEYYQAEISPVNTSVAGPVI